MSLINEVLNELENRGALNTQAHEAIRAIPPHQTSWLKRHLLLVAVLIALLSMAAISWLLGRSGAVVPEPRVANALAVASQVEAASAPGASDVASADPLRGKPLLEVPPLEQPAAPVEVVKSAHKHQSAPGRAKEQTAADWPEENTFDQEIKKVSPQQRAESEYQSAILAAREGRMREAEAAYRTALRLDPLHHAARRALVGILIAQKQNDEAEGWLRKGISRDPRETSFSMLLARLQVERGAEAAALETLQKGLPHAENQAEFRAFLAAVLQRQGKHADAIPHFQAAVKLAPGNGIWLMGLGISLQAVQRNDEARDAYQKALASNGLNAQLQAFVQNKLKEL